MTLGNPRIQFRVPAETKERTEALAKASGTTVSEVVRKALDEHAERLGLPAAGREELVRKAAEGADDMATVAMEQAAQRAEERLADAMTPLARTLRELNARLDKVEAAVLGGGA